MTIVLRLQGLNIEAGSEDIRTFFEDVCIPEGGVCIIGGSLGEAFIQFTTERDGQLAMRRSGCLLRGSQVTLHISSLGELKEKIDSKLQQEKKMESKLQQELPSTAPRLVPSPDAATTLLNGLIAALQGMQSNQQEESNNPVPHPISPTRSDGAAIAVEELTRSRPGYVRLFGLRLPVTKQDICCFFKGLQIQEVISNVKLSLGRVCCLVKFADTQDASDALHFNNQWLGSDRVEVRGASEKIWTYAVQQCHDPTSEPQLTQHEPQEKPLYDEPRRHRSSSSRIGAKRHSSEERSLFTSPKRPRSKCVEEYYVMVKNLSKKMTKTDIKELFGCPNIPHSRVIHLLDKDRLRTDTAFFIFHQPQNYVNAMNLSGCHVGSQTIEVSSITREKMKAMLSESRMFSSEQDFALRGDTNKTKRLCRKNPVRRKVSVLPTAQTCLYVRNMPADVQKTDVKELFSQFKLNDRFIIFLCEGEAVVQFKTENFAATAQKRNGQNFLGSQVLMTRISVQQMQDLCETTKKGNKTPVMAL